MGRRSEIIELIAERDKAVIERDKILEILQENIARLMDITTQNQYGSLENVNNKIMSLVEHSSERLNSLFENQQKWNQFNLQYNTKKLKSKGVKNGKFDTIRNQ